jgi:hypothetical protein
MDDLNRRIHKAKDEVAQQLREKAMEYDDILNALPPPEKFVPYATMFKLEPPGEAARSVVRCLTCQAPYPLQDVLADELYVDQCPTCKTWAEDYWREKPHRKAPLQ